MAVVLFLGGALALLAGLWLYLSWNFGYWRERGVPSSNPLALTGDRGDGLAGLSKPFYELLSPVYDKYRGKERFVGTFQARRPVLVVLDPELAKTILTKEFSSFHGRGHPVDESDPFSNNLFFLNGPRWKNLRAKLSPTFTSGKLKYMFPVMAGISEQLDAAVKKAAAQDSDHQVELKELLVRYSTDVIGSVAFGIDCNTLSGENNEFFNMSRELFNRPVLAMVRFFLIMLHPVFAKLLPFKHLFSRITDFFVTLMRDAVEHRESNRVERADFVQLMMQVREEDRHRSDLDRASHLELSYENMAAQAFLFFVAGLDNISNTVGFALHELAFNPELQRRVLAEIRAAKAKHGGITYEALRDMDLVERVVREALRKYAPNGLLTREPNDSFQLPDSDVVIDKSVMVMIPVWQHLHDPDLFPEPQRFDPDRFTDEAKRGRHPYTYLPFGEGPRFCIAERFTVLEMKLCLTSLLDKYHFEVGSKTDVTMTLDPKSPTPTPKHGFWLKIHDTTFDD